MDFQVNLNLLGWFLACVLLESFIKFLVYPYYELLLWFMIMTTSIMVNLSWTLVRVLYPVETNEVHINLYE